MLSLLGFHFVNTCFGFGAIFRLPQALHPSAGVKIFMRKNTRSLLCLFLLVSAGLMSLETSKGSVQDFRKKNRIKLISSNTDLVESTYIDRGRLAGVRVGDKYKVFRQNGKLVTEVVVTQAFDRMSAVKIVDSWLLKDGMRARFAAYAKPLPFPISNRRTAPETLIKKPKAAKKAGGAPAATAPPAPSAAAPEVPGAPPAAPGIPGVPDAAAPAAPAIPGVPDANPPGAPAIPGVPDANPPGAPAIPGVPDANPPGAPAIPGVPDANPPGAPPVPGAPDANPPGAPALPTDGPPGVPAPPM
jgi:hypothetical protein